MSKLLLTVEGRALDETVVLRQRKLIESYGFDQLGRDCQTRLKWWMNEDQTWGFELNFYEEE